MLGKIQMNNLNLKQGKLPSVENYFLYVGRGNGTGEGKLTTVNNSTDLDKVLGEEDFTLKMQLEAARKNAGQNWFAAVLPLAEGKTWDDGADFAIEALVFEAIVVTDHITKSTDLEAMQGKAETIMGKYMLPVFFICTCEGIKDTESWTDFQTRVGPLTDNVAADQVNPVATIWPDTLGVYCGRLTNRSVTVADSPMRVATEAVVAEWSIRPKDKDGRVLDMGVLDALDKKRWSVPQWYPNYPGVYFGDGNVLDVPGGDYQVIENLRVIQKAMRKVYPLLVARVADRRLNSTPESIEMNKTYFMRPLREMSKSQTILGQVFPGEIKPPKDNAIVISWPTRTSVQLGLAATPYNSPKEITANLFLDLTNGADAA